MALGPLRGPCPDLRSVGLRGSRLQAGRKRRAPDEGRAPGAVRAASAPPFGGRRPRARRDRCRGSRPRRWDGRLNPSPTQSPSQGTKSCWDEHSWSARLCHPPSQADSRAAHSEPGGPRACGGGGPGLAGNSGARQVEPADWLKLRTVTLLLEHLNREGEPVAAPSGLTAPKKENRSPPREGKGQGGGPRENPRPPSGGEGSKDSGLEEAVKEEVRENLPLKGRRRRTTPTSTTRKTRRKKRLRTMTRWSSRT